MMNKTLAYFSVSLLVIGLVVALALSSLVSPAARAESDPDPLEGTWRITITGSGGFGLQALFTFARGGALMATDEAQLTRPIGTNGQGVWTNTGGQYAFTWESFLSDPYQGFAPVGRLRVHGTMRLTGSDSYTGVEQFEFFDLQGNLVNSGCASDQATRMTTIPITCPNPGLSQSPSPQGTGTAKGWKQYALPLIDKQHP